MVARTKFIGAIRRSSDHAGKRVRLHRTAAVPLDSFELDSPRIDIVDAQGNKIHSEAAVKFDGKDYPIKGSPIAVDVYLQFTEAKATTSQVVTASSEYLQQISPDR